MTSSSPWSLSVKRVGMTEAEKFTVHVNPDSDLASLYTEVEGVTGIKAKEQRLIYRGRLLATFEKDNMTEMGVTKKEPKIKDVIGLCDGQTIHLVPKPPATQGDEDSVHTIVHELMDPDISLTSLTPVRSNAETTSSTASLLAAILGLNEEPDESQSLSLGDQLARLRSTRLRGRRRPNHRLTAEDLQIPDPGSMEPVRQALMTLHTMVRSQTLTQPTGHRQWYRGQWMDVRDTVNQWLEATVVDIVRADEILPQQLQQITTVRPIRVVMPTTDTAVSANDFEGRMRLLLEPCDTMNQGEWDGYRQRDINEGVQLLLIHYNGWPHRWDEWIRSDSERIRPFRTRTRHTASSSTASPSPMSSYIAAPSTHIKGENEPVDRSALLPELQRVMAAINSALLNAIGRNEETNNLPGIESRNNNDELPWIAERDEESNSIVCEENNETEHARIAGRGQLPRYSRRELEQLAPLLDRLGRALTDAAPHIASFASTLPKEDASEPLCCTPDECNVAITGEADIDDELTDSEDLVVDFVGTGHSSSLGTGMFSLSDGVTTNVVLPNTNTLLLSPILNDLDDQLDDRILSNDPDNSDFVAGMVNTVRGENRTRRVSPGASLSNDDGSNLLSAYLAAASLSSLASDEGTSNASEETAGLQGLGRLIRQRETGGGGIDIHIHAFVTGPGVGPGTGFTMVGDPRVGDIGGPSMTRGTGFAGLSSLHRRHRRSHSDFRAPIVAATVNEDEMGIFSELYSENPSPVDLQSGVLPPDRRSQGPRSFDHDDETGLNSTLANNSRVGSGLTPIGDRMVSRSPGRRHNGLAVMGEGSNSSRSNAISRMFRRALGRRSNPNNDRSSRRLDES